MAARAIGGGENLVMFHLEAARESLQNRRVVFDHKDAFHGFSGVMRGTAAVVCRCDFNECVAEAGFVRELVQSRQATQEEQPVEDEEHGPGAPCEFHGEHDRKEQCVAAE